MKKRIVMCALAMMVSLAARPAQAQGYFRPGVFGGVTLSKVTGDSIASSDFKTGITIGGKIEYVFSDLFSLEVDGVFTRKGADNIVDLDGDSADVQTSYIQIPLLANVNVKLGEGRFRLYVQGGGGLNFNTGCQVQSIGTAGATCGNVGVQEENVVWSVMGGAGIGIDLNSNAAVTIGGRYEAGLSDAVEDESIKDQTIHILVGGVWNVR